jgi:methionyl-tRNA synthetase
MSWGIEVPGDSRHVFYVWFDALINYISSLGWPDDQKNFENFWPGVQIAGKDNLRQQASIWQAMLFAANLSPSRKILINGFISINGQKMSKSLGNVIAPQDLVNRYGQDASRFLLINLGAFGDDVDLKNDRLNNDYKDNLVNCLGNLCSRLAKMSQNCNLQVDNFDDRFCKIYTEKMNNFKISPALNLTMERAKKIDQFLAEEKPWKLEEKDQKKVLTKAVQKLLFIAKHLEPFMPKTKEYIFSKFYQTKIEAIKEPLFPRIK